ncbi:hypothetical protein AVEN_155486-1 [Araneus ventricosus]|uniref:Uncharacterized protein n=1 Tax=Araneus ventricosus TaxID=182803 RepID=A0A4Y2SGZ7_ARAVE|nr:hypothetical protein AVEN_155486-1 [Araneus ventricosus]
MENEVYLEQFRRTQSTGTIALYRLRTQTDNSPVIITVTALDLATQTVTKSLIMTVAELSQRSAHGFSSHCNETQTPSSHSEDVPPFSFSTIHPSSNGRGIPWNHPVYSVRIPLLIEIEKIIAFSESSICRQSSQFVPKLKKWSPRSVVQASRCRSSITYPCKTLFPTLRLTLQGSGIPYCNNIQMSPYIYPSSNGRDVTWNHPGHSFCVSPLH